MNPTKCLSIPLSHAVHVVIDVLFLPFYLHFSHLKEYLCFTFRELALPMEFTGQSLQTQVLHVRQLLHHLPVLNLPLKLQLSVMVPHGNNVLITAHLIHPADVLQELVCFAGKLPLMLQQLVSVCFSSVLTIPTSLASNS